VRALSHDVGVGCCSTSSWTRSRCAIHPPRGRAMLAERDTLLVRAPSTVVSATVSGALRRPATQPRQSLSDRDAARCVGSGGSGGCAQAERAPVVRRLRAPSRLVAPCAGRARAARRVALRPRAARGASRVRHVARRSSAQAVCAACARCDARCACVWQRQRAHKRGAQPRHALPRHSAAPSMRAWAPAAGQSPPRGHACRGGGGGSARARCALRSGPAG
jgi:hypothetical protein